MPSITLPADGDKPYGAVLRTAITTINDAVDDISDPWISYTPTFTNFTLGNGTAVTRYKQVGETVDFSIRITMGSTSVMGTGPTISLPVACATDGGRINSKVEYIDSGTATMVGEQSLSTSNILLRTVVLSGSYLVTGSVNATTPFTWTTNDAIFISGTYEAA